MDEHGGHDGDDGGGVGGGGVDDDGDLQVGMQCKDGHGGDLRLGAEVIADSFADYLQIRQDSFAFSLMLSSC